MLKKNKNSWWNDHLNRSQMTNRGILWHGGVFGPLHVDFKLNVRPLENKTPLRCEVSWRLRPRHQVDIVFGDFFPIKVGGNRDTVGLSRSEVVKGSDKFVAAHVHRCRDGGDLGDGQVPIWFMTASSPIPMNVIVVLEYVSGIPCVAFASRRNDSF